MRYLLDTLALLAHHRQERGWEMVQAVFEDDEAEIIVASVSLPEFGRRLRDLGASETVAQETLTSYQLLCTAVAPVDAAVAFAALVIGWRTPRRLPRWMLSSPRSLRCETRCSCIVMNICVPFHLNYSGKTI